MSFVTHDGKQIVPLWINGKATAVDPTRLLPIVNAKDETVVHYAQGASVADAHAAADAAASAFKTWRLSPHSERRRIMLRAADILEQRAEEIAQAQILETSCAPEFAHFLPRLTIGVMQEIAGSITAALTGSVPPVEGEGFGLALKQPIGPVLCISPWNSPTVLGMRGIASALCAGCTVVLKSSEICPRTYQLLVDVLEQAGLPKGCLNFIQAARSDAAAVTEALIAHPQIRKVEFIGSAGVGSVIGQIAAKHLKPVLMELGGKGAALVLDDANLVKAAQACAWGAFLHHGQICFSTERIIVVKSRAEEFSQHLKAEVIKNYSTSGGCAASQPFAENAHAMVEAARENGAKLLVGDNSFLNASKTSLKPTILTGVQPSDKIRDHETFGPSASLYVVDDAEAAVTLANDSAYGLNAAVWTEDAMKALDVAKQLEYGQVYVNSTTVNDPATMPTSGTKGSGWGTNNGQFGISEFLLNKSITLNRSDALPSFGA